MANEPVRDFRTFAAIELGAGSADMKIAQSDGAGYRVLGHLRKRPPGALQTPPDANADAACESVRALLAGFALAARDFGAPPPTLMLNGLSDWSAQLTRLACEFDMPVFLPDAQQCADMAAAAVRRGLGAEARGCALILTQSAETRFLTGDGLISQALPAGIDAGRYDYLLRADELERARRKGGANTVALLRDCARACARSLPVPEPGAYNLTACMSFADDVVRQGEYTAKQLARLADDLERRLRELGTEPGYARAECAESYAASNMRRALNALLIADEVRARTGFTTMRIVGVAALDEALHVLAQRDGRLEHAGADTELARRGVEYYARTRGVDTAQTERVRVAAGLLSKALARAFIEEEQATVAELMELAPTLVECFSSGGVMRVRDVARLPGLGTQRREQLLAICEACLERDNSDVYAHLVPDAGMALERDEEALFNADIAETDDFAAPDDDEDDVEPEGLPSAGDAVDGHEFGASDAAVEIDAPDDAAQESGDALPEPDDAPLEPDDASPPEAGPAQADAEAANRQYYALRLHDMASAGMREYAEMFGGDEHADELPQPAAAQMPPVHVERDITGPQLVLARELPLTARVASIIMLARALSVGGAGRLGQLSAKLGARSLVVRAAARDGAALEALEFRYRAGLVKRIFGIKARLKLDKRGKQTKQRRQDPARHNS